MDSRVLRYFLTVAQEENMTKAAKTLHTSQSNLSKQISALEDSLGLKLFERGGRKLLLTEEGLFLKKRAQKIIELTDRTEREMKTVGNSLSGTIHIGGAETSRMKLVGESVRSFTSRYPNVRFDFFSASTAELVQRLDEGLLDCAVLVAPVDMKKYNYLKFPESDRFGLLLHRENPLTRNREIRPEDIGNLPVWVARQQLESNRLSSWLGRDVESLNILATFNLITTPAMMIEMGIGMAFTFENLVRTEGTDLLFLPLRPNVEADLYLVWKKHGPQTRVSEKFLKQVKKDFSKARSGESPSAES